MSEKFFKLLFKPGEGICSGDYKAKDVGEFVVEGARFFSVNPLDFKRDHGYESKPYYREDTPRRADINVSSFRNFMYEMDTLDLKLQCKIFKEMPLPFASLVYSGGKSIHAIISLENELPVQPHVCPSVEEYKYLHERIRLYMELFIKDKFGLEPTGKSFFDASSKNPSRLSRVPGSVRDNGKLQELLYLGRQMSADEFSDLLIKAPEITRTRDNKHFTPEEVTKSVSRFWHICPKGLANSLKYVDWADQAGMYPHLYRLTTWAIDATNVNKDTFIEILGEYTFPRLRKAGYPEDKMLVGVEHAYRHKGEYSGEN